ncbi:sulfurtransferase [Erythrobacter sp. YT30]|uniref:sulfurtransferase n=1 Tax=Erythrobacter sp. YT30 TaxID=1735012 RepID=UPI00076DC719|nr:sulfurtransferase [Erythrobacter sp. YT30]KWV90426.1 3-mercaptopyruvate sulfurtransferase [Erythrobacter sp. YT30]
MSDTFPVLVSTQWLADALQSSDIKILDASMHLPNAGRDARAEFEAGHIPGAQFLDLASFTDKTCDVPAALPNKAQVEARLAELGATGNEIVLYDDSAVKTSARAWFALKAHGVENVAILDGGMAKWRAEGRGVEEGEASSLTAGHDAGEAPSRVRYKADMLANIESKSEQVVDARSADRVFGHGIDPVHGGQNGRIPGSFNVPFNTLFKADGTFKSPHDLRTIFEEAGVDPSRPITTTCGSGVTASVLLFALELIGKTDTALYDGSWSEWSADPATPKAAGPQ